MNIENLMILFSYLGAVILVIIVLNLLFKFFSKSHSHLNNGLIVLLFTIGLILLFLPEITELSIFGIIKAKLTQANQYLNKIKRVETEVKQTKIQFNNELRKLNEITKVSQLIMEAENDNRQAFNILKRNYIDTKSEFSEIVGYAYIKVRISFISTVPGYLYLPSKNDFDPTKFDVHKFRTEYYQALSIYHPAFLNLLDQNEVITEKEKMQLLADILKNDTSLVATYYAGKFFCELSQDKDLKWDPFNTDSLLKWWDSNKSNIK